MFLDHKIPPPIVTLIFIGLIFGSTNYVAADIFPFQNFISLATLLIGLGFMFLGVREFKKLQTTVNPLNPEAATSLVTSGVFSVLVIRCILECALYYWRLAFLVVPGWACYLLLFLLGI